ncbi:cytochrome c oxidase subunit 4 isoform 1, mitochondrial-like [Onthophagus taurus]|uniref:cytochrome c oxidase subunit 4 isoform 1, mitochondrial-like n=1 Tax=Onthophagus taurus TaxID=166361 RepID=UPI0039BDE821
MIIGKNIVIINRLLCKKLISKSCSPMLVSVKRNFCMEKCYEEKPYDEHITELIGNREMVGYGWNGTPCYADLPSFPFPSIRYKEETADIMALKEKERGDWRLLSIDEKKELYRASFCQTFSEFMYSYSGWMAIVGYALIYTSLACWGYIFINYFIHNPKPKSFRWQYKHAYTKRILDLHVNPFTGTASQYDYEKKEWKKGLFSWLFEEPYNPYGPKEKIGEECP